jgi:hypothetical protein
LSPLEPHSSNFREPRGLMAKTHSNARSMLRKIFASKR